MKNNPLLQKYADRGFFTVQKKKEGYSIKVFPKPEVENRFVIIIQGADGAGLLYGVSDFKRYYINDKIESGPGNYYRAKKPFLSPMPFFEKTSAPAIDYRGFWTWGHTIYDYRGYFRNMRECKLNIAVLWNDYAPINARELIEYAHDNGIKVVWGYTWCWGDDPVDPRNKDDLEKWKKYVVDTYERQYLPLGADGIYFQTFTETTDTKIGGASISDLVVDWVNNISAALYEKYPDIWIQFGVHATSVNEECVKFQAVDKRMSIVWEDAGISSDGSGKCSSQEGFPYGYNPMTPGDVRATYEYTKEILSLRGKDDRFGTVFKGFTYLDWSNFENQKGPFILGEALREFIEKRKLQKNEIWYDTAPYWVMEADNLKMICSLIAEADIKEKIVTALVEDGMWECGVRLGPALLAEYLWDPSSEKTAVLEMLFHAGYGA
jgi:hypothetical protein